MHYDKDGCQTAKGGGTCNWSHKIPFTNAEKNALSVIAGKRKKEQEKLAAENAKQGKAGRKGGKQSRSNSRGRGKGEGKGDRKSDQPCRSWEQSGTCNYGDSCRFVHVAK